ncbi:MAG: phosphonate C-P lyase system protein PhnG [Acidimicrobiales bacterium]
MRFTAERRTELLAIADRDALVGLAQRCLPAREVEMTLPPETGTLLLEVREPVVGERFHLGEVLVTRAEVRVGTAAGWAMRMGDDRAATLAAAVCDAEVEAGRPLAGEVLALCDATKRAERAARAAERAELAPTEVCFEELD